MTRYGGSFAPPLSDDLLTQYRAIIDAQPASAVKDAMATLHNCCAKWWDLPESTGAPGKPHPSGVGMIVDLDAPIAAALAEHIPWAHELEAMKGLFDAISATAQKDLRDAAHHLLWHAVELEHGREPLTNDKL
jgi:hypothetical protein